MTFSNDKALELNNVGVVFKSGTSIFRRKGEYRALSDISFSVNHGETFGVVGGNGAGKSTLLKVLAGILLPDTGSVTNYNVTVSLLTLNPAVAPLITARENVILSGMLMGLEKETIIERLPEIFEFAELTGFEEHQFKNLSTGMKSRLGFSIALNLESDVLLIDEALAVGDAKFKKKSRDAMRSLISSGRTVILVSHSSSQIRKVCDKALWIDKGYVKDLGNVSEVMDKYDREMGKED